jgi:uncharacterized protein YpmB
MNWLKQHAFIAELLALVICASIAWGVLSSRVEANTEAIKEIKDDAKLNRADIVEMKGDIKVLLDRTAN